MSGTTQRFVLKHKTSGEYYTVMGWTPTTTDSLGMAVVFPNDLLGQPDDRKNWKRANVDFSLGFTRLKGA